MAKKSGANKKQSASKQTVKQAGSLKPREEAKADKRRLQRRDTDSCVERLFEETLIDMSEREKDGYTDEDGHTCRQVLKQMKREKKGEDGRISQAQLSLIRQKFKKDGSKSNLFNIKDHNVKARGEFHRVLVLSMLSNPSKRKRQALYSFMKFCKALNQSEMVGLARSVADLNCVAGKANAKHVVEVKKFLVLQQIDEQHPDETRLLRYQWEAAFANMLGQHLKSKKKASAWFEANKPYLKDVCDVELVQKILASERNMAAVADDIVTAVKSSKVCEVMFSQAKEIILVSQFQKKVQEELKKLPSDDKLTNEAVLETKEKLLEIAIDTKQTMGDGKIELVFKQLYRGKLEVEAKCQDVIIYIDYAMSLWLRSILAANESDVPALVFEDGMFPAKTATKIALPASLTMEMAPGRKAINDLVKEANVTKGFEIMELVTLHWDDLVMQDSMLELDRLILKSMMANGGLQMLQTQMLAAMPNMKQNEKPVTISHTLSEFERICEGKLFKFVSAETKGACKSSMSMVSDLKKGALTEQILSSFSGFDAKLAERLPFYLSYEQSTGTGPNKKTVLIVGSDALPKLFAYAKSQVHRNQEMVEPLLQFAFKLKPEQKEFVTQWSQMFLTSSVKQAVKKAKTAVKDEDKAKSDWM